MNKDSKTPNEKFKKISILLSYLLIPAIIIGGAYFYMSNAKVEKLQYYEVIQLFDDNKVEAFTLNLSSGELNYRLVDDKGEDQDKNQGYSQFLFHAGTASVAGMVLMPKMK